MKKLYLTLVVFCGISLAAQVPDKPLLKVFDTACRSNPQQNVMLSPWGIQQCFGMLINWTSKAHSAELDTVLGLNAQSRDELQNARLDLQKTQAEFNSFSAALFDRQYTLKRQFVQDTINFFGGKLYRLDLSRKNKCAAALNGIVKRESSNMFDNVFSPQDLDGNPAMILLNVLYFKSDWADQFEKELTKKERFMVPGSPKSKAVHHRSVDMMNKTMNVPYYNDGSIHGIILGYADRRFKMLALTTVENSLPLETVTRQLAQKGLHHFVSNSSRRYDTIIKLPKLKLENRVDLKSLLSSMGLKGIFDPQQGSLSMIQNSAPLFINQSRQIVKLTLNENGTEVAAVTIAIAKCTSAPPQEKYNRFYADHPFVLVLFDSKTQAILLTAAIVDPDGK